MPRGKRSRKTRNRLRFSTSMGNSLISGAAQSSTSSSTEVEDAAPSGDTITTNELLQLFLCPICYDYTMPPIMQCFRGHRVCNSCRKKIRICPMCRGFVLNVRNLAMDDLASKLMFPCIYSTFGCTASLKCKEKRDHEETCPHRGYMCPCTNSNCNWQGPLYSVYEHLKESHKNIRMLCGENIRFVATEIQMTGTVDWVMVESCFDSHFLITLSKMPKNNGQHVYFAFLRLIGNREETEKFIYFMELAVNKLSKPWHAQPRSMDDNDVFDVNQTDCLIFDENSIEELIKEGSLAICVSIRKI